MDWCDTNNVGFIIGLSGDAVLAALVETAADAMRTRRSICDLDGARDPHGQRKRHCDTDRR
jgi:hypothetical protein